MTCADGARAAEKDFEVVTADGEVNPAPSQLKANQGGIMDGEYFLQNAGTLNLDVFGSKAMGRPRAFKTGSYGWYTGGKIPITIGSKKVWAQLGVNLTIPGSKEW